MDTFLKFLMWICAALAFVSFFFMAAGTACGNNSILVLLIGTLAFLAFSSAAQFLKNYLEWREKEREREAIKRFFREIKKGGQGCQGLPNTERRN